MISVNYYHCVFVEYWIVFRNGTIVSKRYIIIGNKGIKGVVYDRITGKQIINFTPEEKREIENVCVESGCFEVIEKFMNSFIKIMGSLEVIINCFLLL